MPVRRSLTRLLWWIGVPCLAVLAVIGGLGLRGPGLVAVGVAGLLAASIAVGLARDTPGRPTPRWRRPQSSRGRGRWRSCWRSPG
ncbi:hypothetical protein [Blastococcus brunescens]|uniref:Uncharacterized protein n=1 Tax=Blastococcus brunescens TaxID=1564165 RepID=A0ABZ1B6D3_9ACTN|nr:hypothetical protein [Blastococcus sp. BMG 8361]WRL64570.1 hypothetical protein U6N30_01805 [Blastococcus sp. BMG 8361]